jgi:hypothetical protein
MTPQRYLSSSSVRGKPHPSDTRFLIYTVDIALALFFAVFDLLASASVEAFGAFITASTARIIKPIKEFCGISSGVN